MSQKAQDWFRGSFAAWLCAILLGLISWNANKLHDKVEKLSDTLVEDREAVTAIITSERARIDMIGYKLDVLTRAVGDVRKNQPDQP